MILNETIIDGGILIESSEKLPDGVLCRVRYPICNIGQINANHRIYGRDVWDHLFENKLLMESIKNRSLFGHAEHPEGTQSKTPLISHVITKMWMDEAKVYQEMDILDTPEGRIVDCLLRAKCNLGVSTRAEGDLREDVDESGNKCYHVIPESYNYKVTDFTADPSTFGVFPIDVKRNVVSAVRKEIENKEAKPEERKFAIKLLESMECDHIGKCQNCGCCEAMKNNKTIKFDEDSVKKYLDETIDFWRNKKDDKNSISYIDAFQSMRTSLFGEIKEPGNTNEDHITVNVAPALKSVVATGNVKQVAVSSVEPDSSVEVTVETSPPQATAEPAIPIDGTQPDVGDADGDILDDDIELSDEDFEEELDLDSEDVEESKINEAIKGSKYKDNETGDIIVIEHIGLDDKSGEARVFYTVEKDKSIGEIFGKDFIKKFTVVGVKSNETKEIKALYTKAGLKPPKGKGIHTKAFHKCAVKYAPKIKSGKMTKKEAYKRCMGGMGKKHAVKKAHQRNESVEEVMTYIDEMLNESVISMMVDSLLTEKGYKVNYEELRPVLDKIAGDRPGEEWTKFTDDVRNKSDEAIETLKKYGLRLPKPDEYKKLTVEESKINEGKDILYIDETGFGNDKFGIYRKPVGGTAYLTFSFPTREKAVEAGKAIAGMLDAEFSETKPGGITTESKSAASLAKDITDLQIREATARAERDLAVESFEVLSNKDLEVRILTKKLKESKDVESDEVLALRTKLEEKAQLLNEIKVNEGDAAEIIKDLSKKITELEQEKKALYVEIEKMSKEIKDLRSEVQKKGKENESKIEQTKKDIRTSIIKEYLIKELGGLKISDDQRALLESCQTIIEVDKALDEYRDVSRRRALHADRVKTVIIEKREEPVDPIKKRQKTIINNVLGYKS